MTYMGGNGCRAHFQMFISQNLKKHESRRLEIIIIISPLLSDNNCVSL